MSEQERRVRAVFDGWAGSGRADRMGAAHEPNARRAFQELALQPGERFLDVGCGVGYAVRWAASDARVEALGVDLSPAMIERARRLSDGYPNARYRVGAFPGPWLREEGVFDAIFTMEVLYYLDDPDGALWAAREALGPGGRFACVIDYYDGNPGCLSWPDDLGVAMDLRRPEAWASALREAGFADVRFDRLREPLLPGEAPTWKHEHGSLFLFGRVG